MCKPVMTGRLLYQIVKCTYGSPKILIVKEKGGVNDLLKLELFLFVIGPWIVTRFPCLRDGLKR